MKTIATIRENINVTEIRKNDKYEIFVDATDEQVIEWSTSSELVVLINSVSVRESFKVSAFNTIISFEITNEEVINLFRELYKITPNKFIKSVLVKVGQERKYSEKQISCICEELIKFENLVINF